MDRITAAKVFVDLAYSGSFTKTADRLEMSRPMVSRHLEFMESWMQARLFHRTTRKISLTSAGEACLPEVEQWLQQAERLAQMLVAEQQPSGQIRLATSMSFGFSQLVPALAGFMARYPQVTVDLTLQDRVTDLTAERIDLALRFASNPDPSLIGKPIALCDSVLVAAPEYLQQRGTPQHPDELQQHDCVGYRNFGRHVWHLSHRDGDECSVSVNCRLTADEATALMVAAQQGMGISMQPTYLVSGQLARGELQVVLPEWQPDQLKIYVLYVSRKHQSLAVRALIDYLEDWFREHPWG
ncbi:LysR family transcriptional regulator [Parathalassolituus penaei]|uniref:LysR family transcriptional regulator n=1 Tax=Parathalassolituus penaei TaxID=2997323 RepID=A0A9X3EFG6_9GAMM|nr:LysR family transcriptional regulator [Parathalassolituus penaei]MCY0966648.1 LysR family transcriptional regulator [Parathalassolituus penaei]